MPNKQPSFAERVAQMHDVAEQLKVITEIVALEAIHMAAAAEALLGAPWRETRTASPLEPAALPVRSLSPIVPCLHRTTSQWTASCRAAHARTAASQSPVRSIRSAS